MSAKQLGDLKPLFIEWLKEEIDACGPRQEKMAMVYFRACESLKRFEQPITETNKVLKVKGIGNSIKNKLASKLTQYCQDNNIPLEDATAPSHEVGSTVTRIRTATQEKGDQSPKRKKRKYVPRKRSGAYAILLGALELGCPPRGLTKEEIIDAAAKYCDVSFVSNPLTREFYSAWTAIKVLIEHDLILEQGRPRRYIVTEAGEQMAETLKDADSVIFPEDCPYQRRQRVPECTAEEHTELSASLSELVRQEHLPLDHSGMCFSFEPPSSVPSDCLDPRHNSANVASSPHRLRPPIGPSVGMVKARWHGTSYELWKPGSYDIELYIDHREVRAKSERDFFVNALLTRGVNVEGKALALGDMVWVARHKDSRSACVLNFMLERKRLDDLAMSIRDNRFMEQKNRLKKTGCKHIFYLVEETSGTNVAGMEEAIKTSIWMTYVYSGFHVKRTRNADDTVEWLHDMTSTVQRYYRSKGLLVLRPREISNQEEYGALLSSFRLQFERDNTAVECCHAFDCYQEVLGKTGLMTVKELYIRTLMLNRGVSLEKALAVQSKFPTLRALMTAFRNCKSEEDGRRMLYLALLDQPASRRVGKALAATLWNTFGHR
ncbi:AaceriAFR141Cp [[Ashbya] aceris (nom. inval.)]|nr:AaceriAFR141Cp [[Ashbya] aceris (nom. inval.)]